MKSTLIFSKYGLCLCKIVPLQLKEMGWLKNAKFKNKQRAFVALACLSFAAVHTPTISWSSEKKQLLVKDGAAFWAPSRLDTDKKKVGGFCTLQSILRQHQSADDLEKTLLKCYQELDKISNKSGIEKNWSLNIDVTKEMLRIKQYALRDNPAKSTMAGVGIILDPGNKSKELFVKEVIKGSPADHAGIRAQDVISEIDGRKVAGMSIHMAIKQIRGREGSKISIEIRRGRIYQQISLVRKAIDLTLAKDLSPYAIEYSRLLIAYLLDRNFKAAEEILPITEKSVSDKYGEESTMLADLLKEKALLFFVTDRHQKSVDPISRAIQIYEGKARNAEQLLQLYSTAITIQTEARNHFKALNYLDRALALYEANPIAYGANNVRLLIGSLGSISPLCSYLRLPIAKCFGYANKAQTLATKYLEPSELGYRLAISNYAGALISSGRKEEGVKKIKEYIELSKKYDPSNIEGSLIYLDLLSVTLEQDKPWEAERYRLEAYDLARSVYGKDSPKTLKELDKLSVFYLTLNLPENAYRIARQAYLESLWMKQRGEDADEVRLLVSSRLSEIILGSPDRFKEIPQISKNVSDIVDKYSGRIDVSLAALPTLINVSLARKNYSGSAALTTRYISLLRDLLKRPGLVKEFAFSPLIGKIKIFNSISQAQEGLAAIYALDQKYQQAEDLAAQSVKTFQNVVTGGSNDKALLASKLRRLAIYQILRGKLAAARKTILPVIASLNEVNSFADVETSYLLLGLIAALENDSVAAVASFQKFISISSAKNYSRLWQTPSFLRNQLASSPVDDAFALYQDFGNHKNYYQIALLARLNFQGVAAEVERLQADLFRLDDQNKSVYERLKQESSRSANLNLSPGERTKLNASIADLQAKLIATMPGLNRQIASIESVSKALPNDGVLIEYQKYISYPRIDRIYPKSQLKQKYLALVLDSSGNVTRYDLGPATVIDAAVHHALKATSSGSADAREKLNNLTRLILAPLKNDLKSKKEVFVSPDAELNLVPFSAIASPLQGDRLFSDAVRLRLLTTGRELIRLQQAPIDAQKSLVFSNPNYEGDSQVLPNSNPSGPSAQQRSSALRSNHWKPLPATEYEGNQVASLLGTTPITGDQATTVRLQQSKAPRVLHVASHGFFTPDRENGSNNPLRSIGGASGQLSGGNGDDSLLRSGLVFAGANKPNADPNDDGYLTSAEAAKLQLDGTELVVLSACDTGRGDIHSGEGVYGLQRALTVAGARSTLLSLWKVDDKATAEFMVRFYKRLKAGESRSDALAATQKDFHDGKTGIPGWSDPYYWAAWQLVGDWRPIKGL